MITAKVIAILASIVKGLLSLVGSQFTVPSWVADLSTYTVPAAAFLLGLHNWIALKAISAALVFLITIWAATWGLRLTRIAASFVTLGGGSAA